MAFGLHPCASFVEQFRSRPFQGQDPYKAKVVVLGSDANYSPSLSHHPFFEHIVDYHRDGVSFWRAHHVHHPFLMSQYPFDRRKDGVVYHRNFSRLGLTAAHAGAVSFVELLDVPTTGVKGVDKDRFFDLLSKPHLTYLESVLESEGRKLVLVSPGVVRDVSRIKSKTGLLSSLSKALGRDGSRVVNHCQIHLAPHFSASAIWSAMPSLRYLIGDFLGPGVAPQDTQQTA